MMPPVIHAAALKDRSGGRALSAAAVSSFHLQDLETERLHFEDNAFNSSQHEQVQQQQLCPSIPPNLGEICCSVI